ncbi:MAG TPA: biopolymer transporter ExbD [Bacteroidales bacterium]|jgi:biopolymer transport protein ExbD|nr:biopolymer transporter ExbD [Bacteroidales bacterium]HNW67306.1 biopolymer transporter ExbD [Bacteroidales bacterium]HPT51679.1 biopolymer transporter ExbD [Bacteroidales bacterium]
MARKTPAINTGSMADISFLLLTFFLMVSSINSEQGIMRMLPQKSNNEDQPKEVDIKERNILKILVRSNGDILINGTTIIRNNEILSKLKDEAKLFFSNPQNLPNLPEKKEKQCGLLGTYNVSQGVVELTSDNGATFESYIMVQNELSKAINELRDELSFITYGKNFDKLDESLADERKSIMQAIPLNIKEKTE